MKTIKARILRKGITTGTAEEFPGKQENILILRKSGNNVLSSDI